MFFVYGSLFATLVSEGNPDLPEKCTGGCPLVSQDEAFVIKNVIECLYTDGELRKSTVFLGKYVRVCEIERHDSNPTYTLTAKRLILY